MKESMAEDWQAAESQNSNSMENSVSYSVSNSHTILMHTNPNMQNGFWVQMIVQVQNLDLLLLCCMSNYLASFLLC